jgi:hypothetical protein
LRWKKSARVSKGFNLIIDFVKIQTLQVLEKDAIPLLSTAEKDELQMFGKSRNSTPFNS